ncbi:FAD-dependent oxidoreductase [Caulobacter sp. KR2-114]|uniref:FAD-dependent oxidoreductase n=1 Tax=Caulobacter sp. KR2-114 TaxID=3400912 RepID=UPI003BFDFD06
MPRNLTLDRRRLIGASASLGALGLGSVGLGACATAPAARPLTAAGLPAPQVGPPFVPELAPIRARADRLFDITVCLRPFRAAGPRLDTETVGDTLVVHNYGHGGSGWSLSWGSSTMAVRKAMAGSPQRVAVIGCGALGLTSATLAQQAGAQVTIYCKDLLPDTRSSRATGSWTPDSRIALTSAAGPKFGALWEEMARISFKTYRRFLGLPGTPVEWVDHYVLADDGPQAEPPDPLGFASYGERIADLTPRREILRPGSTPFPVAHVSRNSTLMFNIADYGHTLIADFLAAGGRIEHREFHDPSEIAQLPEKVVINCTGYGARALWKDESITPVRGQIAWLIPQPEVRYGVFYRDVNVLPRRDGMVVQALEGGDMKGYGNDHEVPDRAEAEHAVGVMADLYARFPRRA